MSITLIKLTTFRPYINGCNEQEPPLREILAQYYANGGFLKDKAYALADEYLRALKGHLNAGPNPLDEALNSGDGSYRP
jgi:hypothetical protein